MQLQAQANLAQSGAGPGGLSGPGGLPPGLSPAALGLPNIPGIKFFSILMPNHNNKFRLWGS